MRKRRVAHRSGTYEVLYEPPPGLGPIRLPGGVSIPVCRLLLDRERGEVLVIPPDTDES